jgi:hypothetical protein
LGKELQERIIKKEKEDDAVQTGWSEKEDGKEGRKVRMQMTFIYSTVTSNPRASQLLEVKFSTRAHSSASLM